MIKSISTLIIIVLIGSIGWLTPVQTVCKVELKNGEKVEGYISVFNQNTFNYFEKGFLITNEIYETKFLFSLDFEGFQIEEKEFGRKYLYGTEDDKAWYLMDELYFIEYEIENKNNFRTYKSDFDIENRILTQREEVISNYKVLDSIEIFQELPKHQHLRSLSNENILSSRIIATKDIKAFNFEKDPSEEWKNKISKKNSFFGGVWWNHEIQREDIKDQKNIRKVIRQKLKK